MIPLKLTIKNFLSYGLQQEIDFEPYSLICLSGKNGHGKSALLDALTWVIWGQARKSSGIAKADEGLLHLGQTHMMVSLTLICNGIRYLIKREYQLTAQKGQAQLEFGILEGESGTYRALTDKTIRATQAKIIQIIGLDYEGFINSAFLRQGQSQEFSTKTPKERKEILASILGLEHFEELRQRALTISKDAGTKKEYIRSTLTHLEEELSAKQLLEDTLSATEERLATLHRHDETLRHDYENHTHLFTDLQKRKIEIEKTLFKREQIEKKLEEELFEIRTASTTWRSILYKQRSISSADALEKEHDSVQKELTALQFVGAQKLKLTEEFLLKRETLRSYLQQRESNYIQARESMDRDLQNRATHLATLHKNLEIAETRLHKKEHEIKEQTFLLTVKKQSTKIPDSNEVLIREKAFERKKAYYHSFQARLQSLKNALEAIYTKQQFLGASETNETECPLCKQLTQKEKLITQFNHEEHSKKHQIDRLVRVCTSLHALLITEHKLLKKLKVLQEESRIATVQITDLEKQLEKEHFDHEELKKEVLSLNDQKLSHEKLFEEAQKKRADFATSFLKEPLESLYVQLEQDVVKLENQLAASTYKREREEALIVQMTALNAQRTELREFMHESALQSERKRVIYQRCSVARQLKQELSKLIVPNSVVTQEAELLQKEYTFKEKFAQSAREKEDLIHQKGSLEAQVKAMTEKSREMVKQKEHLKENELIQEDYTTIATALGKEGIQALLIEDALPEIEEEANNLLSRLTDNRAHISIDSLRDTKSGKSKETLDIKISDAVGVRPYEMFSGGEAFRIDFSLRVALSKLLARRAGTSLQTLIIDEGFGSQDEEGLAHIMEALHTIREDFEKVIVVSHLSEMKEQFPVHFHVEKTAQGSVVQSIEHC